MIHDIASDSLASPKYVQEVWEVLGKMNSLREQWEYILELEHKLWKEHVELVALLRELKQHLKRLPENF